MSNLYSRIDQLCKNRKVSITVMCKEAEVSRASLSDLKMGRNQSLSADTLSKIAAYFGVSVDYLLGSETEKAPTPTERDERDILDEVDIGFYQGFKELDEADKQVLRDMVRVMRERRANRDK